MEFDWKTLVNKSEHENKSILCGHISSVLFRVISGSLNKVNELEQGEVKRLWVKYCNIMPGNLDKQARKRVMN